MNEERRKPDVLDNNSVHDGQFLNKVKLETPILENGKWPSSYDTKEPIEIKKEVEIEETLLLDGENFMKNVELQGKIKSDNEKSSLKNSDELLIGKEEDDDGEDIYETEDYPDSDKPDLEIKEEEDSDVRVRDGSETSNIKEAAQKSVRQKRDKCLYCDYTASHAWLVVRHTNAVHSNVRNYKCEFCPYSAKNGARMKHHIDAVHFGLKYHECPHCDFRSSCQGNVRRHIIHRHETTKSLKCDSCDFATNYAASLRQHVKAIHQKIQTTRCELCDFTTSWPSALRNHMNNIHHKTRKYKCELCDYAAIIPANLSRHVKNVHDKIRDHKCKYCEFAASTKSNIDRHTQRVHEKLAKPLKHKQKC